MWRDAVANIHSWLENMINRKNDEKGIIAMANKDFFENNKIHGITFAPFAAKGSLKRDEAKVSLKTMAERTGCNFVLLAPAVMQANAYATTIDYTGKATLDDEEIIEICQLAKELGLKVILKPTVNCLDGTWRAHINFFDEDVPCEPKWGDWFASYTKMQMHYAALAEKIGIDMFIPGCEMVMTDHREKEWRQLIADLRTVYSGPISYNCDKYQEHNVKWWDCVDAISSSGYYPITDWSKELDRIEKVVTKFNKPFFFAEAGCMSVEKSNTVPNDWGFPGEYEEKGQADWYRVMFDECQKRSWVSGMVLWSWTGELYSADEVKSHKDYDLYLKEAEGVVKEGFKG